jgi:hypothetical protein
MKLDGFCDACKADVAALLPREPLWRIGAGAVLSVAGALFYALTWLAGVVVEVAGALLDALIVVAGALLDALIWLAGAVERGAAYVLREC